MWFNRLKLIGVFLLVAFAGLIAHEGGHGVVVYIFGGKVTQFTIGPGIQILPSISKVSANGTFGSISYSFPPDSFSIWERSTVIFMGAATTALLALLASFLAQMTKRRNLKKLLLIIAILWPLDILTYSIFPNFGLRHWIFFGGFRPEPYEGAIGMGISPATYFAILGLYTIGIYSLVVRDLFFQKKIHQRGAGLLKNNQATATTGGKE